MITMGMPSLDNLPVGKMLSGFFDKVEERQCDSEFYLVGQIDNVNMFFFSEKYKESKNIEQLQNAGIMNENGDLLC